MYALARALMFALEPETSHEVALAALAAYGRAPGAIRPLAGTSRQLMGLTFRNPVGLAAGSTRTRGRWRGWRGSASASSKWAR